MIRTAIVGTGGIARSHAEAVRALAEQVELVAAVDTDPARLADFRERYGLAGRVRRHRRDAGPEARRTVEFLSSLYKSAITGQPVRRGSIHPGDPFLPG